MTFNPWDLMPALGLAVCLMGCPQEEADDDSAGTGDETYEYSGTVTSSADGTAVEGLRVEVADQVVETAPDGTYSVELPDAPPQQVTFVRDEAYARTYVDCELQHDYEKYDSEGEPEHVMVTIEVTVSGAGDVSGLWGKWATMGDNWTYLYSLSSFSEVAPGQYTASQDVRCLDTWVVMAGENAGERLEGIAWEQGGECVDGETISVSLTMDDSSFDTIGWDGTVEEGIETVGFTQWVEIGEFSTSLELWEGAPSDQPVEFPLLPQDIASTFVMASAKLADATPCDYAYARETFEDVTPGDELSLDELLEVVAIQPVDGVGAWGSRPDLSFPGIPAEADYLYAYVQAYTYVDEYESVLNWSIYGGEDCPVDTATFPSGLRDAVVGSHASVGLNYNLGHRGAGCYLSFDWPAP